MSAERQRVQDLFSRRADEIVERIRERVADDEQLLLGGLGFFSGSVEVTRAEWHQYVAALRMGPHGPGVQSFGFARWVPTPAAEGPPVALPNDQVNHGTLEPYAPSERVLEVSNPVHRAAMDRARDTGATALSGPIAFRRESLPEPQRGVLMFVPVYRPGLSTDSAEARRAALYGWVYVTIHIGDLVHSALAILPEGLALTIADSDGGALFFSDGVNQDGDHDEETGLSCRRDLEVFGRRWAFSIVALPEFAAQVGPKRSGFLLATGLSLGALMTLAAFLLQRRAREEALAQEAARRRILFEASPDGMMILDRATGAIVEFNTTAHRQLGYTREEFARLKVFDIEALETTEEVQRHIAEVVAGTRGDFETLQRTKQGELRNVHVTAQVIDVLGESVFQCVLRDVTERRRVDEALREAHRQLRQLGDSLPGGYVYQLALSPGNKPRFTYISAGVEQVHGVRPEEVLREPDTLYALVQGEDLARLIEKEKRAIRELRPFTAELRSRSRAGTEIWLWVNVAPTRSPDGSLRGDGVALDITDRKRAEADRLVMSKLESTGLLAGGIAHDYNNLLTAILLGVELAREEASAPEVCAILGNVTEAIAAARELTRQLITFSKGGSPVRRMTEVERLVSESTRIALTGSTVASRITAEPGVWPAELDEGQVAQVIRNLVLNARESMPQGGVVSVGLRNVTIEPGASGEPAPGDFVEITVGDQGAGIAPEVLQRVFDPYFSTKERGEEKGMGLGLTICHSVVKKHGGAISVESKAGKGATFRVLLPARPNGLVSAADEPRPAEVEVRRGKVLVMDDEPSVRKMVAATLEQIGCTVVAAANGEEAVELWKEASAKGVPFDILLLDLTVRNGMGGIQAIRLLREVAPGVPAVLMSGYTESDALADPARQGFDDALRKPFDAETLRTVVARNLRAPTTEPGARSTAAPASGAGGCAPSTEPGALST